MQIPKAFSSPILLERISRLAETTLYGTVLKHFENALYALSYHLEKTLPKGGIICAIYPKTILQEILPQIAEQKKCKIMVIGGTPEIIKTLKEKGMLIEANQKADIYLTEPDGFNEEGAYVKPHETELLINYDTIAIGSIYQWTDVAPATHDSIPVEKTITEAGIFTPEKLKESLPLFLN